MQYKYVKEHQDYSDYASGRVFHSLPGHPAFPVRLASEIFQRCIARREEIYHDASRCVLYDPCCGAGYHLSVLAHLHREQIREVTGSDIDAKAVELAGRNLELVTTAGLDKRMAEISEMIERYGKESHREALESAQTLRKQAAALEADYPIEVRVFRADATDQSQIAAKVKAGTVDIVFTDLPYGFHSDWADATSANPPRAMLDALLGVLSSSSIVTVASDKQQKVAHEGYQRLERFQVGKRQVVILKPGG